MRLKKFFGCGMLFVGAFVAFSTLLGMAFPSVLSVTARQDGAFQNAWSGAETVLRFWREQYGLLLLLGIALVLAGLLLLLTITLKAKPAADVFALPPAVSAPPENQREAVYRQELAAVWNQTMCREPEEQRKTAVVREADGGVCASPPVAAPIPAYVPVSVPLYASQRHSMAASAPAAVPAQGSASFPQEQTAIPRQPASLHRPASQTRIVSTMGKRPKE